MTFNLTRRARCGFRLFLLAAVLGCVSSGCAAITDPVVPTYIAPNVRAYVNTTNGPMNGLYWSLSDAKRFRASIEIFHALHEVDYFAAKGANDAAYNAGTALQDKLFDPETGYVTLGVAGLMTGGASLLAFRGGLKRPRPGDIPPDEHNAKIKAAGLTDPAMFQETNERDRSTG